MPAVYISLEEMHPFLYVSSVYVDSLLCRIDMECSHTCDVHEALLDVSPSQHSDFDAQELNSPLLFIPDFGVRFLDQEL